MFSVQPGEPGYSVKFRVAGVPTVVQPYHCEGARELVTSAYGPPCLPTEWRSPTSGPPMALTKKQFRP